MKFFRLTLIMAILTLTACTRQVVLIKVPNGKTPPGKATAPGQIKKQTGSKSASPYAPGQTKKQVGGQPVKKSVPGQKKKE